MEIPRLKAIVCGFEHGGTTLMSTLLAQHPSLATGFEVGALLYKNPEQFFKVDNPWIGERKLFIESWGLGQTELDYLKDSTDFAAFYERLHECSPVVGSALNLIDKTPRYQGDLSRIVKLYEGVPVIVMFKDPILLWASHQKRNTFTEVHHMVEYYKHRVRATDAGWLARGERVIKVHHEDLVMKPDVVMSRVFRHVGLDNYFNGTFDSPYETVHGTSMDQDELARRYAGVSEKDKAFIRAYLPAQLYYEATYNLMETGFLHRESG